jgi:hypothetical protein
MIAKLPDAHVKALDNRYGFSRLFDGTSTYATILRTHSASGGRCGSVGALNQIEGLDTSRQLRKLSWSALLGLRDT